MILRRLAVAASAAALVASLVWAGDLPRGEVRAAEPTSFEVAAPQVPAACPGPVTIPVGETASGDDALDSGSSSREWHALGADNAPAGDGFLAPDSAGASVERVGSGDVAGLAALTCDTPRTEQWLVGGSTATGDSARLVLTNPTGASVEATVEVYGPLGPVEERTVMSVPPTGQADVLLEGVAPGLSALAVRITASGAGVAAALQDSRLDGFQPAGTDWVVPGSLPATSLAIASVGPSGEGAEAAVVRLLAPEGATASLRLLGPDGEISWGGVSALVLEPGVVTEVAVPAAALAAVEVRADAPVLAAALTRLSRAVADGPAGAEAAELAWSAGHEIDARAHRTLAGPHADSVVVYAPEGGTFTLTDGDGEIIAQETLGWDQVARVAVDVPDGTALVAEGRFAWVLEARDDPAFLARLAPRLRDREPTVVSVVPGTVTGLGG